VTTEILLSIVGEDSRISGLAGRIDAGTVWCDDITH